MVRRAAASWQAFALLLVVWGNAAAYLAGTALPTSWVGPVLGLSLVAIALLWARGQGLTRADLGLAAAGAARSALAGLGLGLLAVGGAVLVLRYPPLLGEAVTYGPLVRLGADDLAGRIGLTMPLDTILPEEIAFRGVLLAALLRRYALVPAVLLSAAAFTGWHLVIVAVTVAQTNLSVAGLFAALGTAGALTAILAGGVAFAALRLLTRSLAAPIVGHWAFNGALLLSLRALA